MAGKIFLDLTLKLLLKFAFSTSCVPPKFIPTNEDYLHMTAKVNTSQVNMS